MIISFSISQFWHTHICNLHVAWTKILAFNLNMGTHKCSSYRNTTIFWFQQCTSIWFASRSCRCCLSWKCGHSLISQEIMSGETPRDLHFSFKKRTHTQNPYRPMGKLFTCQEPIHRTISTVKETSNISRRTEHWKTSNPKYWSGG